jgi:hypothetical protein
MLQHLLLELQTNVYCRKPSPFSWICLCASCGCLYHDGWMHTAGLSEWVVSGLTPCRWPKEAENCRSLTTRSITLYRNITVVVGTIYSDYYRLWAGCVVGIATAYGLDGPGIESRWGEIFHTCPDRPWDPPSLLYNGYRVFPRGKVWPERDADPSPPSSAEVKNRVELYLYFP